MSAGGLSGEPRPSPPETTAPDAVALSLASEAKQAKAHDITHVLIEGWARLPLSERTSLSNVAAVLAMAERHVAHEVLRQPSENQALIGVLRQLVAHVVGHYVVGVFSLADVTDEQRKQDHAATEPLAATPTPEEHT